MLENVSILSGHLLLVQVISTDRPDPGWSNLREASPPPRPPQGQVIV
jgi:hypothetical protein